MTAIKPGGGSAGGGDAITPASIGAAYPDAGTDAARPAASTGIIGKLYYATDTGVVYACHSDGSGGALWRVMGRIGAEGRDTTAVQIGGTIAARGVSTNTMTHADAVSIAIVFARVNVPSGVSILLGAGATQIEIGNNPGDRNELDVYLQSTGTTRVATGTISASPTTLHCLAITTVGFTTHWSLDGSAAATASHASGTPSGSFTFALSSSGFPASAHVVAAKCWSTAIGDSDLAVVSAAYATGRIPDVSGATWTVNYHAGWYTAGVLTQQLHNGTIGGAFTWTNGYPLSVR